MSTRVSREWRRIQTPTLLADISPGIEGWTRKVKDGHLLLFVGLEGAEGWHLSISHSARYPTWDEIKEARYRFCPNEVTMGMLLPPMEEYVNLQERTFHLWQTSPGPG